MEPFRKETGIKLVHVPYSGSGTAINGLFDGSSNIMITDLAPAHGLIDEGRLKVLAIAVSKRFVSALNAPTFSDNGYPGISHAAWQSIAAPPRPSSRSYYGSQRHFAKTCENQSFLLGAPGWAVIMKSKSLEEFKDFIVFEQEGWARVLASTRVASQ